VRGHASLVFRKCRRAGGLRAALAAAALAALAAWAAPALADRIVTKTGDAFTGTIVEEDATKVVLKTMSGTMTIPRDTIKSVEKAGVVTTAPTPAAAGETKPAPSTPTATITPAAIEPGKAAEALAAAKAALTAGQWVKAGGLLEGLAAIDDKSFSADDRLAATGALITCYLQIKDAQGAAKALTRRAQLATDPNDKKRLLAAAEALRTTGSIDIGGKAATRYEEAVEASMAWKAGQVLSDAKDFAAKAQRLNEMAALEKAADVAVKKLADADVYVPGYSAAHRKEVVEVLVQNILNGANSAVEHCEKVRPDLTAARFTSVVSRAAAKAWNDKAIVYLRNRQAAEDALKSIKPLTTKFEAVDLFTTNATAITKLLAQLDDYQYYPEGTSAYPPGYYGYYGTVPPTTTRVKIKLRQFN
jgi:hypothetical protein